MSNSEETREVKYCENECNTQNSALQPLTPYENGNYKDVKEFEISEPEFSDLDRGWSWVVLCACFCTNITVGGTWYTIGMMQSVLLEKYGASVSVTSWAGGLYAAQFFLASPISSAVVNKFSCRTAIVLAGLFTTGGFLATAFAPNIQVTIFTLGIIAGLGGSLCNTAGIVAIGFNFRSRRNFALGLCLSGTGFGMFTVAPLLQLARDHYGSPGFFIALAGISAHVVVFGCLCFPSQLEIYTHKQRKRQKGTSTNFGRFSAIVSPYKTVMCNRGVLCVSFSMFVFLLGLSSIFLHLPTYMELKAVPKMQIAYLLSLNGILSIIGRILTGVTANLNGVNEILILAISMATVATTTFIYPFISNYFSGHVTYVVCLGLFFGSAYVLIATVSLRFVGISHVTLTVAMAFFCGGIGSTVGPVLAGICVDTGGTYDQAIFLSAGFILLAALFSCVSMAFQRTTFSQEVHLVLVDKIDCKT